jgi:hypothetical protein
MEQENKNKQYNVPFAYLRAFIIVLVLISHTVLYHNVIAPPFPPSSMAVQPQLWKAIPVTDGRHSMFFTGLQQFNNGFIMSLMFFLSGLFVWKSLCKKGGAVFLRDRLIRLGIPIILMMFIVPLTFMPTYLQMNDNFGISGFLREWFVPGNYLFTGPGWFICLLLIFDIATVIMYCLIPEKNRNFETMNMNAIMRRPAVFFIFLLFISAAAYIPMIFRFPDWHWLKLNMFELQTSRILLYFVYFLVGVFTGAYGIERTVFKGEDKLSRRWIIWVIAAIIAFILKNTIKFEPNNPASGNLFLLFNGFIFVLCCTSCSIAFMAVFLRFAGKSRRIFDNFYNNSYGIYIIHYPVVGWLQYSLLGTSLPPIAKGSIVFVSTLALCWGAVAAIRRIPGVARVI